ncbi:MAG: TrlF family AAA-like ATPase [Parcubacteria group bacterium]
MTETDQYNQFPRGSIWRKWDLQVQTRLDNGYSCLGNLLEDEKLQQLITATGLTETEIKSQEKSITADKYAKLFVNYVTLFTDVSVIGITDHNTGKELDDLLNEANQTDGKLTIIPGVEVSSSHGIHILCLFNSEKPWKDTWASSIEHFMTEIGLTEDVFNNAGQPNNSTKTSQEIMDIVAEKDGICIFAHIATENGLFYRQSSRANGGTAHKDIYTHRFCQIVQIPHTGSIDAGTQNIINGKDPNYENKSVAKIKCSDARKLSEIGSQYAWIKADPIFDGLKQIIFEPDERVKIQEQNPYEDKKKIYFDAIKLSGSKNFVLPDLEIPLNRELIALIGGRGSGKSALLDTFAFLNEEHLKFDQNNKKKIIEYYRDNEARTEPRPSYTFKTSLIDKNGDTSEFEKELSDKTNLELPFLYLGQERLSGIATNDFELTRTVCDLIGIDVNEIGQEVLTSKARDVLGDIDNTHQRIRDIIERYKELGYTEDTDLEKWITSYLSKLTDQQKRLSSKETKETLDEINQKTEKGLKLKGLREKTNALSLGLRDLPIIQEIANFNVILKEHYPDNDLIEGLDVSKQTKILSELQAKIEEDMKQLRDEIIALKKKLIEQGIKEDVNTLLQASENLQRQISNIGKDIESYKQSKKQLTDLHDERRKILEQISNSLLALKNAITQAFQDFQNSRDDSTVEEKELFDKIIKGIEVEGKIEFNFKKFAKRVLDDFLDNRKVANETDLKKMIAGTNEDGTPREITFENLSVWIQKTDLSEQKCFSRDGISGITYYIFTEWADFLGVKAIAKLNGKATEILSIGQRGTLLLKVYLATATAKQVFIIDQPEDNLDNNFIMNELVPLIRKAKQSRQIIMSTHNANLVVNADAEQIIVARLDQELDYLAGSIENPEINKNIRDILEGGEEAFRQRERKYLLNK